MIYTLDHFRHSGFGSILLCYIEINTEFENIFLIDNSSAVGEHSWKVFIRISCHMLQLLDDIVMIDSGTLWRSSEYSTANARIICNHTLWSEKEQGIVESSTLCWLRKWLYLLWWLDLEFEKIKKQDRKRDIWKMLVEIPCTSEMLSHRRYASWKHWDSYLICLKPRISNSEYSKPLNTDITCISVTSGSTLSGRIYYTIFAASISAKRTKVLKIWRKYSFFCGNTAQIRWLSQIFWSSR